MQKRTAAVFYIVLFLHRLSKNPLWPQFKSHMMAVDPLGPLGADCTGKYNNTTENLDNKRAGTSNSWQYCVYCCNFFFFLNSLSDIMRNTKR